jgi:hypothetical protein
LQRRHDFAGSKGLDLELVVGGFGYRLGQDLGRAEQRIERFWPTAVKRHFTSGIDCAMAGEAIAVAAKPMPAALMN